MTDFSDFWEQEHVKGTPAAATAGGHNLLMIGPSGAEKAMVARAMLSILPTMQMTNPWMRSAMRQLHYRLNLDGM